MAAHTKSASTANTALNIIILGAKDVDVDGASSREEREPQKAKTRLGAPK